MNKTSIISRLTALPAIVCGVVAFSGAQMSQPTLFADGRINKTVGVGVDQKIGSQLPMDAVFTDSSGKQVRLGDYFGKRPVILNLIFYKCLSVCTLETEGLKLAFAKMSEFSDIHTTIGKDVDVITLSIDPSETPADATARKAEVFKDLKDSGMDRGWHFLVGDQANISKVVDAVGFKYTLDSQRHLINHPAVIMTITPDGRVSQYFFGSGYPEKPLHQAIMLASTEKLGKKTEEFWLGCFCIDPLTGKYTVNVEQSLKVGGYLTILLMGGSIFLMSRPKKKPSSPNSKTGGSGLPQ